MALLIGCTEGSGSGQHILQRQVGEDVHPFDSGGGAAPSIASPGERSLHLAHQWRNDRRGRHRGWNIVYSLCSQRRHHDDLRGYRQCREGWCGVNQASDRRHHRAISADPEASLDTETCRFWQWRCGSHDGCWEWGDGLIPKGTAMHAGSALLRAQVGVSIQGCDGGHACVC